jgi:hypothetical protein
LDRSKRHLQVLPNPEKEDLVKYFVNSYWQMSLRNHHHILKRHLKGNNRYSEHEMDALMQSEGGAREVEESMPRLPVEQLSKLAPGEMVVAGKNKLALESASCDPSMLSELGTRKSRAMTDLLPSLERS